MRIQRTLSSFIFLVIAFTACKGIKKQGSTSDTKYTAETVLDSNWFVSSNIYEVNLRQYTSEGTIKAFEKSLPRLKEMGVEILWFMPITPIGIEGRKETEKDMGSYYAVRNYKAFNEDYGTMDDWKNFVKKAHEMGFKVITDWVANHSAPDNPWVKNFPEFYAKDSTGKLIAPFDWTDVRKLDYRNPVLRDSMIAAMTYWVTETGIDGFRCDVAAEVPTDFWKECIVALEAVRPDIFMLAEAEKPELHEVGFDASYAWSSMHAMLELYKGKMKLKQFDSLMNANISTHPANAPRMFFTTNHDENSWNGTEYEKYGNAAKAFAVFSQTMGHSIPLIYSGQELPNKRRLKFFVKDSIQWTGNYEMAPFYKTLLLLRKSNAALCTDASYKKLSTSKPTAVFAFLREKAGRKALVVINFSAGPQEFQVNDAAIKGEPMNVFMGVNEKISDIHTFSVAPWGYLVYDYQ
ncbi:MAG: alpha-amylase family glycosyl hydrolase [Ferruginibacter sp.]